MYGTFLSSTGLSQSIGHEGVLGTPKCVCSCSELRLASGMRAGLRGTVPLAPETVSEVISASYALTLEFRRNIKRSDKSNGVVFRGASWRNSIRISWELVRNADSRAPAMPPATELWGGARHRVTSPPAALIHSSL